MIEINGLKQTCGACPSQWEFYTFDNRPVYVRYRWGFLSVSIGEPNKDVMDAVNGVDIITRELGNSSDGFIEWERVKKEIDKLLEEEILIMIHNKKYY